MIPIRSNPGMLLFTDILRSGRSLDLQVHIVGMKLLNLMAPFRNKSLPLDF
jgi:hypothetical protein